MSLEKRTALVRIELALDNGVVTGAFQGVQVGYWDTVKATWDVPPSTQMQPLQSSATVTAALGAALTTALAQIAAVQTDLASAQAELSTKAGELAQTQDSLITLQKDYADVVASTGTD